MIIIIIILLTGGFLIEVEWQQVYFYIQIFQIIKARS